MYRILLIKFFFSLLICTSLADNLNLDTKNYKEIESDLRNPDRGWYFQKGGDYSYVSHLDIEQRDNITLMRLYFSLYEFQNKSIDVYTLDRFERILIKANKVGIKIIPQFYYHYGDPKKEKRKKKEVKSGRWISPTQETILKHIEQVSQIINKNKDSIAYIHAGFIGSWGEWHSDQYGDGYKGSKKKFRKKIIEKYLNELDKDIYIALRYPSDHKRMKDLTGYERLGLHNDCANYKWDTYPKYKAYEFIMNTPMDGETCELPPKTSYECKDMKIYFKKYQFDSHNISNWSGAIDRWKKGGCFEEIGKKLGYRFVIKSSKLIDGYIYFKVSNVGWGKSFKSRKVSIKVDGKIYKSQIDIKNWKPGNTYVEKIYIGDQKVKFGTLIVEENIKFANSTGNNLFF